MKLFDLSNRIAIVTGGYGHLGSAMVEALVAFNATVIVAGRTKAKFEERFGSIMNDHLFFVQTDTTQSKSIEGMFQYVVERFNKVDILINNAHTTRGNDRDYMSDEDWSYTMDGVLGAAHKCIRTVMPVMKRSGYGKIINIASMYGMVSPDFSIYEDDEKYINPPHYGAAKAGIIQLTKYYAAYLGKFNIQVNSISPGPFPNMEVQKNSPGFIEQLKRKTQLNRIGVPQDMAGATLLLSSNASDFITGHNLVIDGGWTAW